MTSYPVGTVAAATQDGRPIQVHHLPEGRDDTHPWMSAEDGGTRSYSEAQLADLRPLTVLDPDGPAAAALAAALNVNEALLKSTLNGLAPQRAPLDEPPALAVVAETADGEDWTSTSRGTGGTRWTRASDGATATWDDLPVTRIKTEGITDLPPTTTRSTR